MLKWGKKESSSLTRLLLLDVSFPLKCVLFVLLHLAVRLIPYRVKMKMAGVEANPHKNILRITDGVCHARLAIDWLLCCVKMTARGKTRALLILSVQAGARQINDVSVMFVYMYEHTRAMCIYTLMYVNGFMFVSE